MPEYKGIRYDKDEHGIWYVDVDGNKFLVALDDSKRSGKREFIDSENNEKACLRYIDWITSKN